MNIFPKSAQSLLFETSYLKRQRHIVKVRTPELFLEKTDVTTPSVGEDADTQAL